MTRTNITELQQNKADLIEGKVPSEQLPTPIQYIVEVDSFENLPVTGEINTIYVVTSTNTLYIWKDIAYQVVGGGNGSEFVGKYETVAELPPLSPAGNTATVANIPYISDGSQWIPSSNIEQIDVATQIAVTPDNLLKVNGDNQLYVAPSTINSDNFTITNHVFDNVTSNTITIPVKNALNSIVQVYQKSDTSVTQIQRIVSVDSDLDQFETIPDIKGILSKDATYVYMNNTIPVEVTYDETLGVDVIDLKALATKLDGYTWTLT